VYDFGPVTAETEQVYLDLIPVVEAESWKSWPLSDQIAFATAIADGKTFWEELRAKFDKTVWAGHQDGSVREEVRWFRAPGEYTKIPGRKALTPQEKMAKLRAARATKGQ
jgi:hypothetical protein